jgi:hypothetical protein
MVLYGKIDKELEKKFRHKVIERFDGEKGALIKALEEAISVWLRER